MPRLVLRFLLALFLTCTVAACDRTPLEEDMDDPPGNGGMTERGTCEASIDGRMFEAQLPSATTNDEGSALILACERLGDGLLFELRPAGFGEAMLALGAGGNQAQYSAGLEVSNTAELPDGQSAGEVVLSTFTRDRAVGTFFVTAPGFDDGDPVIRITGGEFDVPVQLDPNAP